MATYQDSRWKDGDSARTMTAKYNSLSGAMDNMQDFYDKELVPVPGQITEIKKELEKKLEVVTPTDIGLGNVDNTSDMDKPVSLKQQNVINQAVEPMLTSEPAVTMGGDSTEFVAIDTNKFALKEKVYTKEEVNDLISKIHPVGSIYMSLQPTNPGKTSGVGTWEQISQGRILLGIEDSSVPQYLVCYVWKRTA